MNWLSFRDKRRVSPLDALPSTKVTDFSLFQENKQHEDEEKKQQQIIETYFENLKLLAKVSEVSYGIYTFKKNIGSGAFSKVMVAWDSLNQKQVAVKLIPLKNLNDSFRLKMTVCREIQILQEVRHENVIQLLDVFKTEANLCLVFEFIAQGEFFDYVATKDGLEEEEARICFKQLVDGLIYLHSRNIIHRDLKLENILVEKRPGDAFPTLKIIDFGLARFIKDHELLKTRCGSEEYVAPEVIMGTKYDGRGCDIWSLGIILYAMVVGLLPFNPDPQKPRQLYHNICNGIFSFPSNRPISVQVKNLIKKILQIRPNERIQLAEILQHPWFQNK